MLCLRPALASVLAVALAAWFAAAPAMAAELVLFTRKGCPYCVLWERQIGSIYPRTEESAIAPLRRVQTDRPAPTDPRLDPPVTVTPTFVLLDGDREVGRFSGYTDDLTFWSMLTVLIKRLDATGAADAPSPSRTAQ